MSGTLNSFEALSDAVIQWAKDRNLFEGSNPLKQLDKTSEEFNELQRAIGMWMESKRADLLSTTTYYDQIQDAFGDILVTLIIAGEMLHVDLTNALHEAYDVIKDRKGRMVNGLFIKDES